ncbi:AAA family ATPase [Devosia sp. BK]|uniref:AAA family ATPase n=1 Tax=Devosia sp. BK TaxID=2871706 RepID=UPI00293A30D4|nr:AAA family ATPase [Devosia sp. BK]MDV3251125.1 AAA family ATPase [Devosia sp. BK]
MADNDDYDDDHLEDIPNVTASPLPTSNPKGLRSSTQVLPELMLRETFTPEQVSQLRRDRTACVVIEAPTAQWVDPLAAAGKKLGDWKYVQAATVPNRSTVSNDVLIDHALNALASGGRTLGISQAPHRLLPKAMTTTADIFLKVEPPSDAIIREAIKASTGRFPRSLPKMVAAGLDYAEICAAIRIGSTATACVQRLVAAANAKTAVDPGLAAVPDIEDLHGYGDAMDWCKDLITDLEAWRRDEINFSDLSRCVVLASPPGFGKSTLVRSLAKSARLPLVATSVGDWFANGPGYLDSIIKQIDDAFNRAAANAPAVLFIDEIDGVPRRSSLNGDRGSWWLPVVNHLLLKLDSVVSGASSKLIVIGATNNPDRLDPGLVRPGRLDRIVHIALPNTEALAGIIRQHLGEDLADADLTPIATLGGGSTGADVTAWVKNARRAARSENRAMRLSDLLDQVAPPEDRPADLLWRVAVHEASHAVVSHILREGSVERVSVIRRAGEGGQAVTTPFASSILSRDEVEAMAMIYLGGRCGEEVLLSSVSSGAGGSDDSDLALATYWITLGHTAFGFGNTLAYRANPKTVMSLLPLDTHLTKAVEADLQRVYASGLEIIEANAGLVQTVANSLMVHRYLTGRQFLDIIRKHATDDGLDFVGEHHE